MTINKLSPFMYVVFWCIVCHYTQGTFTRLRMIDESIYRMYLVFISFFGNVFRRLLIKSLYEFKYIIRTHRYLKIYLTLISIQIWNMNIVGSSRCHFRYRMLWTFDIVFGRQHLMCHVYVCLWTSMMILILQYQL